jgi:hypothetical protein
LKPLPPPEDDPNVLILGPGELRDLGEIEEAAAAACGRPAGPIRLLNGYPGPNGWGYRHIISNPDRMRQLLARGFGSPVTFACEVAKNWSTLHQGELERISIAFPKDGFQLALALQWGGAFWSITTLLPFRVHNKPRLYERT